MKKFKDVTILILVDGFLQLTIINLLTILINCHNPYFSRWFSAIDKSDSIAVYDTDALGDVTILILVDGFLQ